MRKLAIGLFIAGLIWTGAGAAEFKSFKTADGTVMDYALVLPNDFRPARAYPVILALPPGHRTRNMGITGLDLHWARGGAERGYLPAQLDGFWNPQAAVNLHAQVNVVTNRLAHSRDPRHSLGQHRGGSHGVILLPVRLGGRGDSTGG